MTPADWHGCYDDNWNDLIVDEAFAHPAKFAPGLIRRIYRHGFERGYWTEGDLIGDPFGGIGGGGIIGSGMGLRWFGVELEPRFVGLAEKNFAKWKHIEPCPRIVQGDSREFAKLVGECAAIVTSPPFADCNVNIGAVGDTPAMRQQIGESKPRPDSYGTTPGQIGALKSGELDAVITSPPYADLIKGADGETETAIASKRRRGRALSSYGGYGATDGNIGNLKSGKLDAVVTSPPFMNQEPSHAQADTPSRKRLVCTGKFLDAEYGSSPGQIGNNKGDTYWQAMDAVYRQCHQAIKPAGVLACVIKDHVKGGKRVPLCDDTWTLLQACGFEPIERCRAMLVKEQRHAGLFGEVVERKERKSFFRRLAEKKGSPPIDWEEVLWVRKRAASWWLNNRGVDTPIREALDMFAVREGVSL